jgi:catechol 2,3-dioxygenase
MRHGDSASFLASGGYHHHIGINTWMGTGAPAAVPGSLGLDYFRIGYPTPTALSEVVAQIGETGVNSGPIDGEFFTTDPSDNRILLSVSPSE